MPSKVTFGPILDHTAVNTTYPRSCLRASATVDEAEDTPVISRIYAGTLSLQAQNLDSVLSSVVPLICSGKFSAADDVPSCLESWTVLHLVLKQSTSSSPAVNQLNAIAQAAQRDFEQFKDSSVVQSRVLIQILRVMDLVLQLGNETSRSVDKSVVQYFLSTAISLISRQTSSKSLLGVCLHIYNTAHSPRLLNAEQVKTLVGAVVSRLQSTNTALTGELLFTIRTLYSDHRQILVANCLDWVVTIAKYMFDSNSYLRQHAIGILNDVNRKVGGCKEISRALHDTFDSEINGELFIKFACRRLSTLIAIPSDARSAFSSWSSVMLALICWGEKPTEKLQQWKHIGSWIEISRQGFQSPSFVVREAAVNAWKSSVYVFAFSGRPEQNAKNLPSLLQPLQMLSSASPALAKRLLGTFNSLLFIANRVQSQQQQQQENFYDTVWNSLVAPGLACFFQSSSIETRLLGVAVLKQLLSGQDVFKQGPRLRVLQTDIPTEEVGKLPMSWVNNNCLAILSHCSKFYANLDSSFTQIWQCIVANLTASISKTLTVSNESLSLLATMASFLRRSELPDECLHDLATSLVKAIGVKSSLNWKFDLSNDLVLPKGSTSFMSITLDFIYSLDDRKSLFTSLQSFMEKADSRDTLEIIKLASAMPKSEQQWLVLAQIVDSMLWKRSESAPGFDQAVISVLLAAQRVDNIKDWNLWIKIFDRLLESDYVQEEELMNLLQKPRGFWPSELGKAFVICNANALSQSPEISQSVIRLVVCDSDPLNVDLSQMTRYFCIQFARQLVLISCKTTLLDFEAVLKRAVVLLDSALVENSDIFASALRSNVISNKQAAQEAWQTHFCDADPSGTWPDRSVMAFAQLHADGIISELPASFPMSCTSLKRKSSEPLLPSTPKRRAQEQVQCISPPASDDIPPLPSLLLLHRLRGSSLAETEEIKREASEIKLETDDDWYTTDLSSSPPAAEVPAPVFSAEQEQLSSLRRNLLGIDMKSSLTNVSEPELLFLERLMMDSLVSLRQNIRSRGISLV